VAEQPMEDYCRPPKYIIDSGTRARRCDAMKRGQLDGICLYVVFGQSSTPPAFEVGSVRLVVPPYPASGGHALTRALVAQPKRRPARRDKIIARTLA
jgi:hypothetical protein